MSFNRFKGLLDLLAKSSMRNWELNGYFEVLRSKPGWFQRDDLAKKTEAAEAIVLLYQELKSGPDLYDALKYIRIELADLHYYKTVFTPDIYLHLLAIASMNKNGYVREKAVKDLAISENPHAIKFILHRLADWVPAVREAAQKAIGNFFAEEFIDAFLEHLLLIEWLLRVQRADLLQIHTEVTDFIFSQKLTGDFFEKLKTFSEKNRLLYFKGFLKANDLDMGIAELISTDRNYLVRAELLKHIQNLSNQEQKRLIDQALDDRSVRVKTTALYATKAYESEYNSKILELISDESPSVRRVARYILNENSLNFVEIYREKIKRNESAAGNILGLAEVGLKDDIPTFEKYIHSNSSKIVLACLAGIHRLDRELSKKYSLELLTHPFNRVRNKSIEILSSFRDNEILQRARDIYLKGAFEQKKTVLRLFGQIGGWNVVGDLMLASADSNGDIQGLAWALLKNWKRKAVTLFTTPSPTEIERANDIYRRLDDTKIEMTYEREILWASLPFFIRH